MRPRDRSLQRQSAPTWSGSLRADYNWPVLGDWAAHLGGGFRLVGARFSSGPLLADEFKTGAYGALDMNADLSDSRYTIRVFAKSLANRHAYLTDTANQNGLTGDIVDVEGTVIQPRTIGLALDFKI